MGDCFNEIGGGLHGPIESMWRSASTAGSQTVGNG
jgi:hypothetical protein